MKKRNYRVGILLFALLSGRLAWSDHLDLNFGPSLNGATNPKFAALGYEKVFDPGSLLLDCGGMFESPIVGMCSLVLSARVQSASGVFVRLGAGPGVITRTDDRLSSPFEFNLQGALGFTQDGWDVGLGYRHYSNAGLVPPNFGRDFWGALIEIGI